MNTQEALSKYKPILDDINRGYSNAQIKQKNYTVDRDVDDYFIHELRHLNSNYKRKLKHNVLSGVATPGVDKDMFPQRRHTFSSSHEDELSEENYQSSVEPHKPSNSMEAFIQNAELKAELRFTKQRLQEKESELAKLQQQGLGSIEEITKVEFLKRDHQTLQDKYAALQKEYDKLVPELEDLLESRKGFEMFKEILETANENKDILMGVFSVLNPALSQKMGGLAGIEQGSNPGTAVPETQKAAQLGAMIIQNFQGDDFRLLVELINIFHSHRELLPEANYVVKQRLQQKIQQAPKVGEEEMSEEFKNAKTI